METPSDTADEIEKAKEENSALISEIEELRAAVSRQSQTILEMDEKLRDQNKHSIKFESREHATVISGYKLNDYYIL